MTYRDYFEQQLPAWLPGDSPLYWKLLRKAEPPTTDVGAVRRPKGAVRHPSAPTIVRTGDGQLWVHVQGVWCNVTEPD